MIEDLQMPRWTRRAACKDADLVDFFDAENENAEQTVQRYEDAIMEHCAQCPVQQKCLEYAMKNDLTDGVWGGMTPEQRKAVIVTVNRQAKKNGTPKFVPHGYNGYQSYKCRCDICTEAFYDVEYDGRERPTLTKATDEDDDFDWDAYVFGDDGNLIEDENGQYVRAS